VSFPALRSPAGERTVRRMKHGFGRFREAFVGGALIVLASTCGAEAPSPKAAADFDQCVRANEARLTQEHSAPESFLEGIDAARAARLRNGEVIVERLSPSEGAALPGALLHDWRGTAFVRGATVPEFEALLRNFAAYPGEFSPQVLEAKQLAGQGEPLALEMRVRQRHGITVTLDGVYDVRFGRLDAEHGWSTSESTRIEEIGAEGQPLSVQAQHGFLWRLDTWWSYEQRDGGLYVQIETVSLTRSIPVGLGWLVGQYVENIPRESLKFTLRAACAAVQQQPSRPPTENRKGQRK